MLVRKPKFINDDVPYFDLEQIESRLDLVELSDEFVIRPDTVYVASLAHAVNMEGKRYYTAMIGINGRCILTTCKSNDLISEYSKRSLTSPRFWHWVARRLGWKPLYFAGENSFVPESTPSWGQTSWIGSRWYDSIYTTSKATFVTFTQPQTQRQVIVRVHICKRKLLKKLAQVRAMLIYTYQLTQWAIEQWLPSSHVDLVVPANLPEIPGLRLPLWSAWQIRQFIFANHDEDVCYIATDECCSTIHEATERAQYAWFPPRELIKARRQQS